MACRPLLLLLDGLLGFNSQFVAQHGNRPAALQLPACRQAYAASQALAICSELCGDLALPPADSLRLLGAARLLFEAGRLVLVSLSDALRLFSESSSGDLPHQVIRLACMQLRSLIQLIKAGTALDKRSVTVFVRTTAKPAAVLPWMAAVTAALQLACGSPDTEDGEWRWG